MIAHSSLPADRIDLRGRTAAALRDYRAIWRVTVQEQDAVVGYPIRMLLVTLVFAFVLMAALSGPGPHAGIPVAIVRGLVGVATAWLAATGIVLFTSSAVLLNSMANAKLLPRQRRRLIQMGGAWWLLTVIGSGAAFASWTVLLLAGLFVPLFTASRAGARRLSYILPVAINLPGFLLPRLPPPDLAIHWPAMAAVALLDLALAAWLLDWLYPAGGDRHARAYAQRRDLIRDLARRTWWTQPGGGRVGLVGTPWLYARTLRRDCRKADPGALLLHACGPTVHWSTWLIAMALLLAAALAAHFVLPWSERRWHAFLVTDSPLFGVILPSVSAFVTSAYGQALDRTHGEQGLLRLSPLAGDAGLLNRRLGKRMLRIALLSWAAVAGAIMLTTLVLLPEPDLLLRQLALSCLAGQAGMMGVLRDVARGEVWDGPLLLQALGLTAALALAAFGLGWLTDSMPWLWMTVLSVGAAVFRLRRDWRRMLAAKPAYPAGRLG